MSFGWLSCGRHRALSDRIIEDIRIVAFEEAADQRVEFLRLEEERVVTEIGAQLGVARPLAGAEQRERELPVLLGRKQPVARETDDEAFGFDRRERLLERAIRVGQIELVERA